MCRKVISLDEYASYFKNIDPVSQYKNWTTEKRFNSKGNSEVKVPRYDILSDSVKAAFVVSDPVDWGRDIQVINSFPFSPPHCEPVKFDFKIQISITIEPWWSQISNELLHSVCFFGFYYVVTKM